MFGNKYVFNNETLSYDKVGLSLKEKIIKLTTYFIGFAVFVSLLSYGIFTYFYDNASYRSMKQENRQLHGQFKQLNEKLGKLETALNEIEQRDDDIYRVMLQQEPIPSSIRDAGFGGTDRYRKLRGFNNSDLIIKTTQRLERFSKKLVVQTQSYEEVIQLAKEHSDKMKHIPAIRPIDKAKSYITSHYGYRFHPILRRQEMHSAIDFSAPIGTQVFATGGGIVEKVSYSGGYGRMVTINHGFGYKTRYAHMHKIAVHKGEKIERGQVIGIVGNSGLSTGPHLHYEVLKNNVKVNPANYYFKDMTPNEYQNVIKVAAENKKKRNHTNS